MSKKISACTTREKIPVFIYLYQERATHLRHIIEARERELVSRAEHMTKQKIETLVA